MADFFSGLFSSDSFLPHGHCYLWSPEILWLHVISDLIIAIAYYSIPLALAIVLFRRKRMAFKWLVGLFAAFIVLCGTTHILGIVTQWTPIYRFEGIVKLLTAGVSIATAVVLFPMLPRLLAAGDELAARLEADDA